MTQKYLKEILEYDPDTGVFKWKKVLKFSPKKIGDIAGTYDRQGYIIIRHKNKSYKAHRLAFLYVYGYIPDIVDHINLIKDDNRISNLRGVSASSNCQNRDINCNSSSGVLGVNYNKANGLWSVRIGVNGVRKFIGYFSDFDDAVKARKDAEKEFWF